MADSFSPSDSQIVESDDGPSSDIHFDIHLTQLASDPGMIPRQASSTVSSRWTHGTRLEMESSAFASAIKLRHPTLGPLTSTSAGEDLLGVQLSLRGSVRVEVDLQPLYCESKMPGADRASSQADLTEALATWAWGDAGAQIAAAALRKPLGPVSSEQPRLPLALAAEGWSVSDMWLLTSVSPVLVPEETPWCVRAVRVVYGQSGAMIVWHRVTETHRWCPSVRQLHGKVHPVPLPEHLRRHGQLTSITGSSGADHAGRLTQDIMQHHDWTEWQLTLRVEAWEREFFSTARDGAFKAGLDARHLGVRLDETHQLLCKIREINRDMDRRARLGWLPSPDVIVVEPDVESLTKEVRKRARRVDTRMDQLNGSLREGWTLLSSAAAGARLQLEREGQERQLGFQYSAALVAALVLVPGLVLSLYGAEVKGLPGMGHAFGLVSIAVYAVAGAGFTWAALQALSGGRRMVALRRLAMGVVALSVITVGLLAIGQGT